MEKELEKALSDLKEQESKTPKEYSKDRVIECLKNVSRLQGELKKFQLQFESVERLIEHYFSVYPDKDPRLIPYLEKVCDLLELKELQDLENLSSRTLFYKLKLAYAYEERNRSVDLQQTSIGNQASIGVSSAQIQLQKERSAKGADKKVDEAIIATIWGQIAQLYLKTSAQNQLKISESTLKIEKANAGEEDYDATPSTLQRNDENLKSNSSFSVLSQKNSEKVVDLAVNALESSISHFVKKYGEEHAVIASVLSQISKIYIDQKDIEQGFIYADRAHKMMKKTAGQDSRETAVCVASLASIQKLRGKETEAINEQKKALEIFEKYHRGKPHVDIAESLTKLADLYEIKHEHEKAFELQEKALSMNRKLHGHQNTAVAKSLVSIAKSLSSLQNHDQAIKYAEAAIHMIEAVTGDNSLELAEGIQSLSEIYSAGNYFKEAAERQRKVIKIFRNQGKFQELVEILCTYASTVEKFELYNEQIDAVKEALTVLKSISLDPDVRVSTLTHNLSYLLCFHGYHDEAIQTGLDALSQRVKLFGEISTNVASTYEILSRSFFLKNMLQEAQHFIQLAIRVFSILCEERGAHTEWARLLDCLAEIQSAMGEHGLAIDTESQSIEMIKQLFSSQHSLYASGIINLAQFYLNDMKPDNALDCAQQGISLLVLEYGDDDIVLADPYELLSKIHLQLGQMGLSTEYQYKSLEINKRFMGERHDVVQQNLSNLAEIYQRQRKYKESKIITEKVKNLGQDIFYQSPTKPI